MKHGRNRRNQRPQFELDLHTIPIEVSMTDVKSRFHFACAPDSWGVLDYPGPSWNQSYEAMLDEMVAAGYTGTELGPYGFFPIDPSTLKSQLEKRNLNPRGFFVPFVLGDPPSAKTVVNNIGEVGD